LESGTDARNCTSPGLRDLAHSVTILAVYVHLGVTVEARQFLSTRQVADRLGVHPQTVRRWEREGVIPAVARRRGQRVYTLVDLELVKAAVMQSAPTKEEAEK